jgi:hypothetical protein
VAETLAGLFGLRTCTLRLGRTPREPCPLYQLGSCHGPCTGRNRDVAAHDGAAAALRDDLHRDLAGARRRLASKLGRLAGRRRFEEAAAHRDAFDDLVRVIWRARRVAALSATGRLELDTAEGRVVLESGRLPDRPGAPAPETPRDSELAASDRGLGERTVVAAWLERADGVRLVASERPLAYPWPPVRPLERIEVQYPRTSEAGDRAMRAKYSDGDRVE